MLKVDTSGLDKILDNLDRVHGSHAVSTDDLMTESFIREHTRFRSWQEMMDAGGVNSDDDIASEAFSRYIKENTPFDGFDDMAQAAGAEWISRQLEL